MIDYTKIDALDVILAITVGFAIYTAIETIYKQYRRKKAFNKWLNDK